VLERGFRVVMPHEAAKLVNVAMLREPVRRETVSRSVLDGADRMTLFQHGQTFSQNISRERHDVPGIGEVRRERGLAIFREVDVPSLARLGDRRRQLHEVLMQVDCGPIEAQNFGEPDAAEKRNSQKRDKLRIVRLRGGHNRCNLCGRVNFDLHRVTPRKVQFLAPVVRAMAAFDTEIE